MSPELAVKLARIARMLTSSHQGEVLAAANRFNALVAANNLDLDKLFSGNGGITREEMQTIYDSGYKRGLADGAKTATPANDDWGNAGQARTEEIQDLFGRVMKMVDAVLEYGGSDFEMEFCSSFKQRLMRWGRRTLVSQKQWNVFNRIEKRLIAEGRISP